MSPKGQSLHPYYSFDLIMTCQTELHRTSKYMLTMCCCILLSILKIIVTDYSKTYRHFRAVGSTGHYTLFWWYNNNRLPGLDQALLHHTWLKTKLGMPENSFKQDVAWLHAWNGTCQCKNKQISLGCHCLKPKVENITKTAFCKPISRQQTW